MAVLLAYRGLKVHYMPHMPELEGVSGKARYENGTMHFDVDGGTAVGLGVTGATIGLTDLDNASVNQYATLHMPIAGPAAQVMAMLSRPKLGLPRDALFDPKRMAGDAAVVLDLRFPLLNDLAVSDVEIKATAVLSGLSVKGWCPASISPTASGKIAYADDQLNGRADQARRHPVEVNIRELFCRNRRSASATS